MKTFKQGIHLSEMKELSEDKKIEKLFPSRVILPLSQHTGAPCSIQVLPANLW